MEISIRWNICRVCLQEENESDKNPSETKMVLIFGEGNSMAKNIYECSGIWMKANDSLPDKICRKCVSILKYAVHFRKSCRESNVYLQSVIEHTKSASTMFKQDRIAENVLESLSDEDGMEVVVEQNAVFPLMKGGESTEEKLDKSSNPKVNSQRKLELKSLQKDKKKMKLIETSTSSTSLLRETKYTVKECRKEYEKRKDIENRITEHQDEDQEDDEEAGEVNNEITKQSDEAINHNLSNTEEELSNSNCSSFDEINQKNYSKTKKAKNDNSEKPELNSSQDFAYSKESEDDGQEMDDVYTNDFVKSPELDLIQNLKSEENEDTLYFIINKDSDRGVHQHEDEGDYIVSDDNVEFIPLEEEEESHHLGEETEDGDDTDNQVQVTSTVVTKEEVDLEFGNSNSIDNSQVIDAEYVLDGFMVDDNEPNDGPLESNISIRSKNNRNRSTYSIDTKDHHVRRGRKKLKTPCSTYVANSPSSSGQPLVCDICGNNFTNRQMMNAHMKIHRQEKTHECELCYKRFITACNLQAHMRIHTGEKPFECKYCSRRFTDRSTHLRHERIHTNEKPFSCEHCGKAFALGTTLHAHRKVHTGERPFRCEPCGKSFKLPHQLKAHKNTHLHRAVEQSTS